MGLMRFIVHDRERIPPGGLEHVHVCGGDDIPWFSRAYFSGEQLIIERNEDDSGRVFVPWQIGDSSPLLISTATLMQRDRPYLLPLELARGKLNQVRNQIADWQGAGYEPPPALAALLHDAIHHLTDAAVRQHEPAVAAA